MWGWISSWQSRVSHHALACISLRRSTQMNYCFKYVNKAQLKDILPRLFENLHANMSRIAPTGNAYEDDYKIWFSNIYPAMEKTQRQIVLMYSEKDIIGYFQYNVNCETFMMEDIQVNQVYHGTGIFSALYTWLVCQLPGNIKNVESYADKKILQWHTKKHCRRQCFFTLYLI